MGEDCRGRGGGGEREEVGGGDEGGGGGVVEEGGLEKELKSKFMEGEGGLMCLVGMGLVVGLGLCIEGII